MITRIDPELKQRFATSCAVKCQQIILREHGIDVEEETLCEIAAQHGWYAPEEGTFMRNNGKLLGCFGIDYGHSQDNDMPALEAALRHRSRVMVNLNRAKLYGESPSAKRRIESNHAVLVNAVDGDSVLITDPATGAANQRVGRGNFIDAWADSSGYMLWTK